MPEKKRKRALEVADIFELPNDNPSTDATTGRNSAPLTLPVKRLGLSRQEKSERRSKKAKKAARNLDDKGESKVGTQLSTNSQLPTPSADDERTSATDLAVLHSTAVKPKSAKNPKRERPVSTLMKNEEQASTEVDAPTITSSKKGDRYICFVGNLPYDTSSAQIKSHFIKIADGIKSIRLGTDKQTGKGKGYAFLEFNHFDKMKTCLKLYHHSIFDPRVEAEDKESKPGQKETGKGRRINVELTAGGGGAGQERRKKIHAKNRKLDEEREKTRLKVTEQAAKEGKKEKKITTGTNGVVPLQEEPEERGAIHPSRLNRVAR